jgi:cellulose synthase/poly-beta-1,6-N-acetylglucosamine synthase-like glycosyltransferase
MELQVGWVYGSVTEDILTGQRIHSAGWRTALLDTEPPAFLGSAPTGGPASLTQYKRWTIGLCEILLSKNNPILLSIFKRLEFRQCLGYLVFYIWSVRAPFELCYALLGPYCLLANQSFLPKVIIIFCGNNIHHFCQKHIFWPLFLDLNSPPRAFRRLQNLVSASSWPCS